STRLLVEIDGDRTNATSAPSSGNDVIQVSDIDMTSDSTSLQAGLAIVGDFNEGAVITGGNDKISVSNVSITDNGGNGTGLSVTGDFNSALTRGTNVVTSTIGGGNDEISISETTIAGRGNPFLTFVELDVFGDINRAVSGGGGTVATI